MHRWYFHRDLKPENLMCSKDNCVLKIIDFGQARARRSKYACVPLDDLGRHTPKH
eukprot:m.294804 g.294804  ORF g.294804 m.294804 type:complete len:55 (+) comp20036_c0_seq22:695-859(+)